MSGIQNIHGLVLTKRFTADTLVRVPVVFGPTQMKPAAMCAGLRVHGDKGKTYDLEIRDNTALSGRRIVGRFTVPQ